MSNANPMWYLPHHPVINENKPDKVRIVFDCSSKFKGMSLNDQVLKGPDLMNNLVGVLLRFRDKPVALLSDIEAMFHQVRVQPDDCDALRYLWWPGNDMTLEPKEYRMVVHLFGGVWSPSCTSYVLLRTADDNRENFDPKTIKAVHRNFYVDDLLLSVDSENEGIHLSQELFQLLSCGGFRLTKWVSNSRKVLDPIPPEERGKEIKTIDIKYDLLPSERALGMQWNVELDTLGYKISMKDKPLTRRGILSITSSLFDPLGLVSPYVLGAKIILQDMCRQNIGWDDQLPLTEEIRWLNWLENLPKIERFAIDRCVKPPGFGTVVRSELHHFSDASESGYGVVSYLRVINEKGCIHCSLLLGKSRLTPIKPVTIPRLELSAATLAVKIDKMLTHELDLTQDTSYFLTDSTIVLQYVSNDDKRFKTFVANRISVIRSHSSPHQWFYVDTRLNPADAASRSLTADELLTSATWLHGPDFLQKDSSHWPESPLHQSCIPESEVKKEANTYAVPKCDIGNATDRLLEYHSSWNGLKKSVAWILKLKTLLLEKVRKNNSGPKSLDLTVEDLLDSERERL